MKKQYLNRIFWGLIITLTIITLVVFAVTPSEFDKTHNDYVFQELLIKYPLYKLKYNGDEISKYCSNNKMKGFGVVTLETKNGIGEVYINESGARKEIPNINIYVRMKRIRPCEYIFSVRKDSSEIKKIKEKEKEMSLGTWTLIFIFCLITAKLANKITWRNIFKLLKRWIHNRKTDWDSI